MTPQPIARLLPACVTLAGILAFGVPTLAACDAGRSSPPSLATSTRTAAAAQSAETVALTIYLPRLFDDDSLGLQPVSRRAPAGGPQEALQELIKGPNGDERARDLQYALDPRTRVLDLRVEGGTAAIELDDAGLRRVHGRPYSELVFWSIVYTMTEVPGVERVSLLRGGVPLPALGDPPFSVPAVAGRQDAPAWVRPREL